jgi:hypothetical protein
VSDYLDFVYRKSQTGGDHGFEPLWLPDCLFPFQRSLTEWALRRGCAAIFADCGLGKTLCQLVWAENVVRKSNGRVLILTPLAVGPQTVREGEKFGIEAAMARDGVLPKERIAIINYEQLHKYSPDDFVGLVADESSRIKHFRGSTQQQVTRFVAKLPYRLLCTATAAPNDYVEFGTSSEALGVMGQVEMLSRFFRQEAKVHSLNERGRRQKAAMRGERIQRLAVIAGTGSAWRLKGHAEVPFWRWVCSWARACRRPSDLGFDDDGFILPDIIERHHEVAAKFLPDGALFARPAFGLEEEREERRRTLRERCERAAELVDHDRPAVIWCHLNAEGDLLEKMIDGSRQVAGADSDEEKVETFQAFTDSNLRVLIVKPKIGAWGLNWQHCSDVVTFASHSFEGYYQSVRRCWRFGQKNRVTVDIVSAEGEAYVRDNMARKAKAAGAMFDALVRYMSESQALTKTSSEDSVYGEVPSWL